MNELDLTEAVEAGSRAWYDAGKPPRAASFDGISPDFRHRVSEALLPAIAAAAPLIEAQVREQVAREIEALQPGAESADDRVTLRAAARIARGGAS